MGRFWEEFVSTNAPEISVLLHRLADDVSHLTTPPRAAVMWFIDRQEIRMGEITVKDSSAPLGGTVSFVDAKGAATEPDDTPRWSSSDEAVAAVVASDDGKSAEVTIGIPGVALIEVHSTDTDGTEVVAQGTVTVQPGEAVIGSVEFSA